MIEDAVRYCMCTISKFTYFFKKQVFMYVFVNQNTVHHLVPEVNRASNTAMHPSINPEAEGRAMVHTL